MDIRARLAPGSHDYWIVTVDGKCLGHAGWGETGRESAELLVNELTSDPSKPHAALDILKDLDPPCTHQAELDLEASCLR